MTRTAVNAPSPSRRLRTNEPTTTFCCACDRPEALSQRKPRALAARGVAPPQRPGAGGTGLSDRRRRAKTASTGVVHLVSSRQSELHFDEGDVQRRKFGGKELEREGGLDLYAQEARLYDPVIARFLRPDDLAEKYPSVSPYAFCLDNPLRNIDPDGDSVSFS